MRTAEPTAGAVIETPVGMPLGRCMFDGEIFACHVLPHALTSEEIAAAFDVLDELEGESLSSAAMMIRIERRVAERRFDAWMARLEDHD